MSTASAAIVVKNLTIGWGDFILMKEISFEVPRGDTFCILGGSGCGKSSLLRHLIGLERAKGGTIDSQTLSFDAYLKLIEDRFLGGQRLDGKNLGWPDARPTVRENARRLGDLGLEFDWFADPIPPLILDPTP